MKEAEIRTENGKVECIVLREEERDGKMCAFLTVYRGHGKLVQVHNRHINKTNSVGFAMLRHFLRAQGIEEHELIARAFEGTHTPATLKSIFDGYELKVR